MGWRDNLRNPKNLGVIRGPHGHASQPHLSVHAKGGRIGRPGRRKDFKTHGRDVPTMAAKGGRIGLRFGSGRTNLLEQLGRVEAERSNPNRRAEISRVHGELNRGYAKGGRAGYKHSGLVGKVLGAKKGWDRADKYMAEGAHELAKRGKKSKTFFAAGHRIPDTPRNRERWKKHDIRVNKAEGGRIGLNKGGKPWGSGPKPGTIEFLQHNIHKRKSKAVGGTAAGAKRAFESFTEKVGGSAEGKPHSTKEGRIASGKRKIRRFLQSRKGTAVNPKGIPGQKPEWKKMPWKPGQKPNLQPLKKGGKADKNWIQKATASIKKRGTKGKCTPITKPGCTGRAKALAKTFKKIAAKRKA